MLEAVNLLLISGLIDTRCSQPGEDDEILEAADDYSSQQERAEVCATEAI